MSPLVGRGHDEQGLLGLAFHPGYAKNRRFYINYTNRHGDTRVVEYKRSEADPTVADPKSAREIFERMGGQSGLTNAFLASMIGMLTDSVGRTAARADGRLRLFGSVERFSIDRPNAINIPSRPELNAGQVAI